MEVDSFSLIEKLHLTKWQIDKSTFWNRKKLLVRNDHEENSVELFVLVVWLIV